MITIRITGMGTDSQVKCIADSEGGVIRAFHVIQGDCSTTISGEDLSIILRQVKKDYKRELKMQKLQS
jgi:hypothetical protein